MHSLRSRNSSKKDSEKTPHRDCDIESLFYRPRRSARLASNVASPFLEPKSSFVEPKPPEKRKRGRPRKYPVPCSPTSTAKSSPTLLRSRKRRRTNSGMDDDLSAPQRNNEGPSLRKSLRIRNKMSCKYEENVDEDNFRTKQSTKNDSDANNSSKKDELNLNWRKFFLLELQVNIRQEVDSLELFSKPIEPEEDEYFDDYDVADKKDVMCFDMMEEMITSEEIVTLDQYRECLGKIVKYVRKYKHNKENFVRKQAELIEERSQKLMDNAIQRWEERLKMEEETKIGPKMPSRRSKRHRRQASSDFVAIDDVQDVNHSHDDSKKSLVRYQDKVEEELLQEENESEVSHENITRMKRPRRRKRSRVRYADDGDSLASSSSSKDNDTILEGYDIPFCNPLLTGSTIESCNDRSEWLRLCSKLATVCNEAARRCTLRSNPSAERYEKPLSVSYIKERIEYDDPLEGFIVRTDSEPYQIQGFILTTRFTTWRKTFRWTFDEPAALITPVDHRMHIVDNRGELTKELQSCERDDSNPSQGYSYKRICEISLLGGLGCGSALLSRALSELRQSEKYDYVVLQSTKIAIPFYEKHGFVRVGAVTRFNDIETLPEVAYRHWSEIVNGVAVEPSYMMGRRLKGCSYDCVKEIRPITAISVFDRREEILKALISAHSLLTDALNVRIGSVAYTNSFREILSAARDFAISADDYHLVQLVDKAKCEFTGSHFGKSKRLLRSELRRVDSLAQGDLHEGVLEKGTYRENDQHEGNEAKTATSIDLVARINFGDFSSYDALDVSLPSDFLSRDDFFNVKVILGGEDFWENGLVAKLERSLKATTQMLEAKELAVDNLLSFMSRRSDFKRLEHSQVGIGDRIMLKTDGYDGSPLWVEATVKRQTKIRAVRPYYSGHNGYIVTWNDPEGPKHDRRVLDIRNRGVGKEWCTEIDWASFAVLPISILDCLLIGGKVCYPALNGQIVEGKVTQRIGGGIRNEPTYRVEMKQGTFVNDYCYLSAGAIREAIAIPDCNSSKTKKLLSQTAFPRRKLSSADGVVHLKVDSKKLKGAKQYNELTGEIWAKHRIQKFSLLSVCEKEKDKLKKITNCDEDFIVHLSTGINKNNI